MTKRLKGKVAVITGAASGIGAGAAQRFKEEGASIIIADLQDEAGNAAADELGDSARFAHCDVTDEDQVAAAVDLAVSAFGRLDIMVNNAGVLGAVGPIAETPFETWDRTISILLHGVFLGMKHAARVMVPQKSGCILSMTSTAGVMGGLGPHAYTAAKHGVVGLTRSVATELAASNVRVNAVAPGWTVTALTSAAITGDPDGSDEATALMAEKASLGFAGLPVDIANALLYLASDEARFVTGHTLMADSGMTTGGAGEPTPFHFGASDFLREAGKHGL